MDTGANPGSRIDHGVAWIKAKVSGGITRLTGDVTAGPGTGTQTATLATVNSNVGSFTNANITVNGKGLITVAANGSSSDPSYAHDTCEGL